VLRSLGFSRLVGSDTYEYEISCTNSYIPPPCIPHYAHPMCEICHCSDHASNSCPYYISDEGFARLSNMIETMNEKQIEFANKMRDTLSPETDLNSSSPRLDVNLCDDSASFPPLEFELEEVLDPPLTTLLTVAPSFPCNLRDNTAFIMTLFDKPSPFSSVDEVWCR